MKISDLEIPLNIDRDIGVYKLKTFGPFRAFPSDVNEYPPSDDYTAESVVIVDEAEQYDAVQAERVRKLLIEEFSRIDRMRTAALLLGIGVDDFARAAQPVCNALADIGSIVKAAHAAAVAADVLGEAPRNRAERRAAKHRKPASETDRAWRMTVRDRARRFRD